MMLKFYLLSVITTHVLQSTINGTNVTSSLNALLTLMTLTEKTCVKLDWCTVKSQIVTGALHLGGCCRRCSCDPDCVEQRICCPDVRLSELLLGHVFNSVDDLRSALRNETFIASELHFSPYDDLPNGNANNNNADADTVGQSTTDDNDDEAAQRTSANTTTECVHSRLLYVSPFRPKSSSYLMVSRCPFTYVSDGNNVSDVNNVTTTIADYVNEEIKAKCESQAEFIPNGTINDFIPVQSATTGVVYRNAFCAQCNDVNAETLIKWDVFSATFHDPFFLDIRISTMTEVLSFLRDQDPFYGHSDLLFEPGETLRQMSSPAQCFQMDYSTCAVETVSDTTDDTWNTDLADLRQACIAFHHPVYASVNRQFTVFNNLACVSCNGFDLDRPGRCGNYDSWEASTPYLARISKELVARRPEIHGSPAIQRRFSSECDMGYIYDKRTDGCRKAYCPSGMMAHEGRCVFIFDEMHNKLYKVDINIDIAQPPQPSTQPHEVKSSNQSSSEQLTANTAAFQSALYQYFTNVFKSDDIFLAENIWLMATKGDQPNPKKYVARVVFSELDMAATFANAVSFLAKHFAGIKTITYSEGNTNIPVALSVTDSIRRRLRFIFNIVTGDQYEQVLPDPDTFPYTSLPYESYIRLSECLFCFMIELKDNEFQDRRDLLFIRTTEIKTATFSLMYNSNGTGYLVCANNVIHVVDERSTPPHVRDRYDKETTPKRASGVDNIDSGIEMLVAFLSLGLVVCFIVILRYCMRRWLNSRRNTRRAGPSTITDDDL